MAKKARRRAVRVRRVVRRVELWSALRMAVAFHLACFAVTTPALVVMFSMARRFGAIEAVEGVLTRNGFASGFQVQGDLLFEWWMAFGPLVVVFNTVASVVGVVLFNALSGLSGGLVFSVLEEAPAAEAGERAPAGRFARRRARNTRRRLEPARTAKPKKSAKVPTVTAIARAATPRGPAEADWTTADWAEDDNGAWLRPTESASSVPGAVV